MKVLHVQTAMMPAGNAAFRLHSAMQKAGIDSRVLTYEPLFINRNRVYCCKKETDCFSISAVNRLVSKLVLLNKRKNTYTYSPMPVLAKGIANLSLIKEADVIYLHWICAGFMGIKDIESILRTGKHVIFFMHDMWTFTGGCHHSFECSKYETDCIGCEMFYHSNAPRLQLQEKAHLFHKYKNITFVSPSRWLAEKATRSIVCRGLNVLSIPNIVDESIFKPINKTEAKQILNLPPNKKIVTFGCQAGTSNPYKGWDYLKEAFKYLEDLDFWVLVYGSDEQEETKMAINKRIVFLGPVLDETKLALICNATDVFVSPSLAESFGLTFLENIKCGTPVVGFDCTAVPEIVGPQTGFLAHNRDAKDLAVGIRSLLNEEIDPMVSDEFSTRRIIAEHMRLCSK